MPIIKFKKLNQRGDTILEVLISVAILSLILTTSFTLANRSSQATRQAAERGESSKFAQSEIEKLKYYLSTPNLTSMPSANSYFCLEVDAAGVAALTNGFGRVALAPRLRAAGIHICVSLAAVGVLALLMPPAALLHG